MIPESALREIQDRLNIVDLIGGYVSLKKTGRNFKGLCPFHAEKTPSFLIYPDKQFFICYGCGVGGDLVTFVMKHEKMEFVEAVDLLAEKAGVEVPRSAGEAGSARKNQALYRAHDLAAGFYQRLLRESPEAEEARGYLRKRGLEIPIWQEFGLGWAPPRWDALVHLAAQEGIPGSVLEQAGLAAARESLTPHGEGDPSGSERGWYDRFRGRVIFPIWDSRGRVIAFGGRLYQERAEGPKYLNSPETELYVKGRILYGLHLAAAPIREKDFCIVVEGYLDVVTPFRHGIRNVVASMGTSLTEPQVRILRRLTRHVVMVYDGDAAGEAATLRGLELFLEAEMRVKVAVLPSGTDPDSLIRNHGVEAFTRCLQESKDLFDYRLGLLTRQYSPREMEGRIRICQDLLPTLKKVPNAIQRAEYIRRLSEILALDEKVLWAEMERIRPARGSRPAEVRMETPGSVPVSAVSAEELLAGLLLEDPGLSRQLDGRLDVKDLQDSQVRELVSWLLENQGLGAVSAGRAFLNERSRIEGDWENRMARWMAWADSTQEKEKALGELLERMRRQRHRVTLEELRESIRKAEEAGDAEVASRLLSDFNRLMKEQVAR